ncbi:MAG: glycosyltransferase family 4 protein [Acidobacteriota bacterium]
MRVGVYSPLPPQRSGIADYTAELLPVLARHAELALIVDDSRQAGAVRADLAKAFPIHTASALPSLLASNELDVVLYHLGNNPDYHAGIRRALLESPGVVMVHDVVLHHLVLELTLRKGDPDAYVEELRYCCGATGEAAGLRAVAAGVPVDPWNYPLFERVVDRSLATLVHNRFSRDRILESRPTARVEVVPLHLSLGGVPLAAEARGRLGIQPDELILASFGFVTEAKRPVATLEAFARLRRDHPRARLFLVGEISPHFDLRSRVRPELFSGVTVTGHLELEEFLLHMAACDVAINLRWPTAGETSAALIRLLGFGKAVVLTNVGSFAEIPDGCCAKVDADALEGELLFAILERLTADQPLRREMGENARRYAEAHHAIEASAAGYARVLREVVERRPRPFVAVPPLARPAASDTRSAVLARVSAGLVDLGVGEADEPALAHVASRLAEIF